MTLSLKREGVFWKSIQFAANNGVNFCVIPVFQGELMNGVKPWRQIPLSEVSQNDATSTLQGLASQRLATADHLPGSIEMSTD